MSEVEGINGVSVADRTVRNLGVVVANAQITLATMNARMEELAEIASQISFDLWDEVRDPPPPPVDDAHEGHAVPQLGGMPKYSVPAYQVDAVVRLVSVLLRQ